MAESEPTFETFIAKERARITSERDKLVQQKTGIDSVIAGLDRELQAISAYENAKAGRAPSSATATRTRSAPTSTGTRRTGQRDAVLAVIEAHLDGIVPKDILKAMNCQTPQDEASVRNALGALKRHNKVARKGGKYVPA